MVGLRELVLEINGVHSYNEARAMLISAFPCLRSCTSKPVLEKYADKLVWAYDTNLPEKDFIKATRLMRAKPADQWDFASLAQVMQKRQAFLQKFVRLWRGE